MKASGRRAAGWFHRKALTVKSYQQVIHRIAVVPRRLAACATK
jgi:hypothetical protein